MIEELKDYDYFLPQELIASYPSPQRSNSRLLVYRARKKPPSIEDRRFYELADILKKGDLLIFNNTRVSQRRLRLRRESGASIEALFLRKEEEEAEKEGWRCLVSGKSRLKKGERLFLAQKNSNSRKKLKGKLWAEHEIEFLFLDEQCSGKSFCESPSSTSLLLPVLPGTKQRAWRNREEAENFFANYGETPIPPYLGRKAQELDRERYQNVYAEKVGSVAAPTAGLHFCPQLLGHLKKQGIQMENLELHLGYGTFAPLREENFKNSSLHREEYCLPASLAHLLKQSPKGRRIAVGTSTLRSLEANYREHGNSFVPGHFSTDLFLKPPDKLHTSQGLITNFHLPASSLLLLVAAYVGKEEILRLYRHAVQAKYRFFSYGDAMLILL